MKKLLLSTVAIVGFSAGAMAADLPQRVMAPAPFVAAPVFTWTGFYVGVNVGAAWNRNDDDNWNWWGAGAGLDAIHPPTGTRVPLTIVGGTPGIGTWGWDRDDSDISILGGVQVGFNWQMTPGAGFVVGVEADIQAIGNRRDRNDWWGGFGGFGNNLITATQNPALPPVVVNGVANNVALFNNGWGGNGNGGDWFGTARIRLGYAFDRFLVYATGGLAFRDSGDDNNWNGAWVAPAGFCVAVAPATCVAPTGLGWNRNDNNNWGWALGVGAEWAFTNNISIGAEYLHVAFDRGNNNWWAAAGGVANQVGVTHLGAPVVSNTGLGWNNRDNGDIDLVRLKVNFRFGS